MGTVLPGQSNVAFKEQRQLIFQKALVEVTPVFSANTACAVSNRGVNLVEGILGHPFSCPPTELLDISVVTEVTGLAANQQLGILAVCSGRGDRHSAPQDFCNL